LTRFSLAALTSVFGHQRNLRLQRVDHLLVICPGGQCQ
jgi:hypothetical protein